MYISNIQSSHLPLVLCCHSYVITRRPLTVLKDPNNSPHPHTSNMEQQKKPLWESKTQATGVHSEQGGPVACSLPCSTAIWRTSPPWPRLTSTICFAISPASRLSRPAFRAWEIICQQCIAVYSFRHIHKRTHTHTGHISEATDWLNGMFVWIEKHIMVLATHQHMHVESFIHTYVTGVWLITKLTSKTCFIFQENNHKIILSKYYLSSLCWE